MKNKRYRLIVVGSLVTIAVLAATVFGCVRYASEAMTRYSYDVLTASTKRLARDYYDTARTDQTILRTMAELLAMQAPGDAEAALGVMNSFDLERTLIRSLELMTPDDWMLDPDGTWFEISNGLAFEAEAAKGAYVSDRVSSFREPGQKIVCDAVPVVKNGETVAMLYGVIPLQEMSEEITTDLYNGTAVVMLVDGTTGDVLLDTWHKELGSLEDLRGRRMLKGYTYEQAVEDLRSGVSGDMRLVSNSTGKVMYMHYEPVGINNWSLIVGVSEDEALAGTRESVWTLYWMVGIVGAVLLVCMVFIAHCLIADRRSVYRMSQTDQGTGLLNRSAYEKYLRDNAQRTFALAACVYIDANGLHEINNKYGHEAGDRMLKTVADCLRAQFAYGRIYRIGGDEFVVFPLDAEQRRCEARMRKVAVAICAAGYTVSYGVASRRDEQGLDALVRAADERMLDYKRAYYTEHDRRRPR